MSVGVQVLKRQTQSPEFQEQRGVEDQQLKTLAIQGEEELGYSSLLAKVQERELSASKRLELSRIFTVFEESNLALPFTDESVKLYRQGMENASIRKRLFLGRMANLVLFTIITPMAIAQREDGRDDRDVNLVGRALVIYALSCLPGLFMCYALLRYLLPGSIPIGLALYWVGMLCLGILFHEPVVWLLDRSTRYQPSWERKEIAKYNGWIPEPVLQKALTLKKAIKNCSLDVEWFETIEGSTYNLLIARTGNFTLYVDLWENRKE